MNNKLVKQFGEGLLSYRLRTARNKKRMQYEDFYKQLIALHKEEKELSKQRWNLGYEALIPPVQKGWKRLFVLRDDVARGSKANFYAGIIEKINTVKWSYRKDFVKKKRAFGKKKYVTREQSLLKPDEREFEKMKFSDVEKQEFHEEWVYESFRKIFVKQYVVNEPWRFVLKVKPNMIDKIRRIEPLIDSRLKEIDAYMDRNYYRNIIGRLQGGNYKWWKHGLDEKHSEVNDHKNKPLQQILDELKEERF